MFGKSDAGVSPIALGLLIFTPLLIAVGQVLFKMVSLRLADTSGFFDNLFRMTIDPIFITSLAIYGVGTILWIFVLKDVPLALAYSFMALTFVFVPVLAKLFLHEALPPKYIIGTVLILAGLMIQRLG